MADLRSLDDSSLSQISTAELLTALADPDPEIRVCAVYALRHHPEAASVEALVTCLGDAGAFLARTAGESLQSIGQPAVPALIAALTHPDAQTRGLAARALAHLKDTSAIPALFKALTDDSAVVQYWAEAALERMGVGQVYFKP